MRGLLNPETIEMSQAGNWKIVPFKSAQKYLETAGKQPAWATPLVPALETAVPIPSNQYFLTVEQDIAKEELEKMFLRNQSVDDTLKNMKGGSRRAWRTPSNWRSLSAGEAASRLPDRRRRVTCLQKRSREQPAWNPGVERSQRLRSAWRGRTGYFFLAPLLFFYLGFVVYPTLRTIWMTFMRYRLPSPGPRAVRWAG